MARDIDPSGDHFDLLPMISILIVLLGTLILVAMSVATLSLGPGVGEGWLPAGGGQASKKAVLIEWDGAEATWHRGGAKSRVPWSPPAVVRLPDGPITMEVIVSSGRAAEAQPEFEQLLDSLTSLRETHYALFAVRPSGFGSFQSLAERFRRREIDVGFEPIAQQRQVRLLAERVAK